MGQPILIGVDGGGSRCRARARLADGSPVGEAEGGSANIFTDLDQALSNIVAVSGAALAAGGLGRQDLSRAHVGLGLAGANIPALADALHARALPFAAHALQTDAVVACLGAHQGRDGAIAILGTGTAYVLNAGGVFTSLGGWGFVVSDPGSGAALGRAALSAALLAFDGIGPASGLTEAVLGRFGHDAARLVEYAAKAAPADFGVFAPPVMDGADAGDPVARSIVAGALVPIEAALRRLLDLGAPRIALLGGLAARYRPRLPPGLARAVVDPGGDAMDGALALAQGLLLDGGAASGAGGGSARPAAQNHRGGANGAGGVTHDKQ